MRYWIAMILAFAGFLVGRMTASSQEAVELRSEGAGVQLVQDGGLAPRDRSSSRRIALPGSNVAVEIVPRNSRAVVFGSIVEEAQAVVQTPGLTPSDELLGLIDDRVWQLNHSLRRVVVELAQDEWLRPIDHLHTLAAYASMPEQEASDLESLVRRYAPVHLTLEEIPFAQAWFNRVSSEGWHEDTEYLELVSLLGFERWVAGVKKTHELYPLEMRLSKMNWGDDASWQAVFGTPCPVKEYLREP